LLVTRFIIGELCPLAFCASVLAKVAFKSIYASIRSACNMPFAERPHAFSTCLKHAEDAKKPAGLPSGF
jgi:hypothetical protein